MYPQKEEGLRTIRQDTQTKIEERDECIEKYKDKYPHTIRRSVRRRSKVMR